MPRASEGDAAGRREQVKGKDTSDGEAAAHPLGRGHELCIFRAENAAYSQLGVTSSLSPRPQLLMGIQRIVVAAVLACAACTARASYEQDARDALASSSETATEQLLPSQRAIIETGAQIDKCPDVGSYVASNGGMGQLVHQAASIDDAVAHCADKTHPRFDTAYAGSLRDTLQDMGHHLKFIRALVAPCVMESPSSPPPSTGAWALNSWLRDARRTLEDNGCVAFNAGDDDEAQPLAQMSMSRRGGSHCSGCVRPVIIATATSIGSTALIAVMVAFLLSGMRPSRHHDARRVNAAPIDWSTSTSVHTPRARHASIDAGQPRGSPSGFKHVEPGALIEMNKASPRHPKAEPQTQHHHHHKGGPEP